jgi:hypothetical protein
MYNIFAMQPERFPFDFTPYQLDVIERPLEGAVFLTGPSGTGKTTAGIARLVNMLDLGVSGDQILLLVPQRTLAMPYLDFLSTVETRTGGILQAVTMGGIARRMVELFWPMVAGNAGFTDPVASPTFLTLETAQYFMAFLVNPLIEQGYFSSVTIEHNRLFSQIIDNLNKAASVGFPVSEIGERLKSAWSGEPAQMRVYEDTQTCASLFRSYCLGNNLLDFSLQLEVFTHHLWNLPMVRDYLRRTFRHLIVDNIEEDTPVAHDLLLDWMPDFDSALIIFDEQAGFRNFLGADPSSALRLNSLCQETVHFSRSFVMSPPIQALGAIASQVMVDAFPSADKPSGDGISYPEKAESGSEIPASQILDELSFGSERFYPSMLDWTSEQIAELVLEQGVPPGEIVVLSPFLSDALRFSLTHRLETLGIPVRSHRPSRSLRDEPATQCLLTLTKLAHPGWLELLNAQAAALPDRADVAYALVQAIHGLDPVRAQLLTENIYTISAGQPTLTSFDLIQPGMQERITYRLGERYENLRLWLESYLGGSPEELDHFITRIFGELLSQPGYGFHFNLDAGEVTANLIESIQKFRWVAGKRLAASQKPLGLEYLEMVQQGVIAAQYIQSWQIGSEEAVLLAPAYTFLMSNHPVDYQIWLDPGSRGWTERLYQPLTHPIVLSRHWEQGQLWTDEDELLHNQETLFRLFAGLIRRCRKRIFLGLSEFSEAGYEQRGTLLRILQRVLWKLQPV